MIFEDSEDELLDLLTCHRSESDGPFPWTRAGRKEPMEHSAPGICKVAVKGAVERQHHVPIDGPREESPTSQSSRGSAMSPTPVLNACDCLDFINYKLPKVDASAGSVLQHSKQVVDMLLRKHSPMTFIVGFTHDPVWRWTNDIYGYALAREKWTNMVVLFETKEPFSPAMLEAALIDLYKSTPGCKNIRTGGDTAKPPAHVTLREAMFSTYIVYRSFKHPPLPKEQNKQLADMII
ncbi:unnamed protein product [Effrenium voratum]|nr:unnamed protein product [Effrenium voratum]